MITWWQGEWFLSFPFCCFCAVNFQRSSKLLFFRSVRACNVPDSIQLSNEKSRRSTTARIRMLNEAANLCFWVSLSDNLNQIRLLTTETPAVQEFSRPKLTGSWFFHHRLTNYFFSILSLYKSAFDLPDCFQLIFEDEKGRLWKKQHFMFIPSDWLLMTSRIQMLPSVQAFLFFSSNPLLHEEWLSVHLFIFRPGSAVV